MGVLIGCDIEKTDRFARLMQKESFLSGVYTPGERRYIAAHPQPHRAAAGLFCAKEAAAKALGDGLFGLKPTELEVVHRNGQPFMRLLGGALKKYPLAAFSLSISHGGDYTMSVCAVSDIEE